MFDFLKCAEHLAVYVLGRLHLPDALVAVVVDLIQLAERAVDKSGQPLDGATKLALVVAGAQAGAEALGVAGLDTAALSAGVSTLVDEANAATKTMAAVRTKLGKSAGVDLLSAKSDVDAVKSASASASKARAALL